MKKTVGFIGLGNIGYPMAKRIVTSDQFNVVVFDVAEEPQKKLAAKGATIAHSVKALAEQCEVIGICVRNDDDVNNLLHDDGILANAKADTIVAIHSTVTHTAMLKWADQGKANNLHIVDAPITGGAEGAKNGTLCYMCGGEQTVLDRLEPVISTSAKKIVHAGDVGQGTLLKLCNNLMNYAAFVAVDEGTRLANSCGLDSDLVYQVGEANGVVTHLMKSFVTGRDMMKPACSDEDFASIFGPFAKLAEKDLDAALDAAKSNNVSLPATEKVRAVITDVFFKNQ